jgi:outer membrane lipoprotein-sorting protein
LLTVKKADYIPQSAEYYDKGGNKIKSMTMNFVKSGKYWYAKTMTVKDLKRNHTTVMTIDKVEFDKGLTEEIFSVRNLKK